MTSQIFEYQINVAEPVGPGWDGKPRFRHLFRTDWIDNKAEAESVFRVLSLAFPHHRIIMRGRDRVMFTVAGNLPEDML